MFTSIIIYFGASFAPTREEQVALSPWLFYADEGDLYVLSAVGAGYPEGDGLLHHPLGNGGNNGVNIIQTLVQHIQALFEALDIGLYFLSHGAGFIILGQGVTFPTIIRLIIRIRGRYVKNGAGLETAFPLLY
jgi:hypothetical protein